MTLLMREREKYKEGEAFGVIEFTKCLGYSDKDIVSALQKTLGLDMDQVEDYLKMFYEKKDF